MDRVPQALLVAPVSTITSLSGARCGEVAHRQHIRLAIGSGLDLRLHRLLGHDSHEKDVLGRRLGRLVGLLLVREDGIEVVLVLRLPLLLAFPCLALAFLAAG